MNKQFLPLAVLAILLAGSTAAQETTERKPAKERKSENIIIRKKGDKKEKVTVVVDGEKVTVNGVPIEEFNDENLEIVRSNGRTIAPAIPRLFGTSPQSFSIGEGGFLATENKAFLGVTTEKADGGAKITSVSKQSAAEKAGLQIGDIITKIGTTTITNSNELYSAIGKLKPEEKVMVTFLRNGKEQTAEALLGKNKSAVSMNWSEEEFDMETPEGGMRFFNSFPRKPKVGLQIQDVEEGNGVKILDVEEETPASKAGLQKEDIIIEVDGKELKNVDELRTKLKDFKEGDSFKVKYKRGNKSQTAEIKLPKKLKTANL
jgi:serine protease Do